MKPKVSTSFMLLWMILITGNAFSQRDFRPGYIIMQNQDTMAGLLLYKAVKTSSVCSFIPGDEDHQVDYSPKDIQGFRFNDGKYYVSAEVTSENGRKMVFLEFLIRGKANIFYMRDGTDHYYIQKDNGPIIELTLEDKIIGGENGVEYVKPEQYTGRIKAVLSDCPELYPEIDRVILNHSSLTQLARDYHNKVCPSEVCTIFERKNPPVRVRFGIYAGATVNKVKFGSSLSKTEVSNTVVTHGDQLVSDVSAGATFGFRVEFENVLTSFEHASLIVGIAIQTFNYFTLTETGNIDYITYNGQEYRMSKVNSIIYINSLSVNLKTYAFKLPLQVNYTFLKGTFRPYVNAGVLNMFVFSQNQDFRLARFTDEFGQSVPTYHLGFILSVGAKMVIHDRHFLFFNLGYQYSQSMNTWPDLRFVSNLMELSAGFSF